VQDVARLAGVSIGTVSNVLNNPSAVRRSTADKVQRAISDLGFVRNDAARQLKAGKSQTIGLVVLDAFNPFFNELARGAEDRAASLGYSLIVGNSANDEKRESNYLKLFEELRVAGVLVTPTAGDSQLLANLRSKHLRTILVDRAAEGKSACSVGIDDVSGGRQAAKHLLDQGRRRIAFVGGPLNLWQVKERLAGASQVVWETPGAVIRAIECADMTVLAGRQIGERIINEDRQTRPDAIFAANDLIAIGLLQAFVFNPQIRVPEDISIIGYDDISFAETAIVSLSSIRQPARQIGETAINLLFEELNNSDSHEHKQVTYQPELIARDSSRAWIGESQTS
jgi:LacI family transcriptional regulator